MIMTLRHTIAAIKPSDNNDFVWFMVDSGAFATRAIEGEFDATLDETKKKTLYSDSVQGIALKVYGEQTPGIEFDEGLRGTMRVTVTDASENVLTVDELLSKEWKRVVLAKLVVSLNTKMANDTPRPSLANVGGCKCGNATCKI